MNFRRFFGACAFVLGLASAPLSAAPLGLTTAPAPWASGSIDFLLWPYSIIDGYGSSGQSDVAPATPGGLTMSFNVTLDALTGKDLDYSLIPPGVFSLRDAAFDLFLAGDAVDFGFSIGAGSDVIEILFELTDPGATATAAFGGYGAQVLLSLYGEFGPDEDSLFDPFQGQPSFQTADWRLETVAPVPLPAGFVLLGSALAGIGGLRRLRRRKIG